MELRPFSPYTLSNSLKSRVIYHLHMYQSYKRICCTLIRLSRTAAPGALYRQIQRILGIKSYKRLLYVATIISIFYEITKRVFVVVTNAAVCLFNLLLFAAFLTYFRANESNLFDNGDEFRLG